MSRVRVNLAWMTIHPPLRTGFRDVEGQSALPEDLALLAKAHELGRANGRTIVIALVPGEDTVRPSLTGSPAMSSLMPANESDATN